MEITLGIGSFDLRVRCCVSIYRSLSGGAEEFSSEGDCEDTLVVTGGKGREGCALNSVVGVGSGNVDNVVVEEMGREVAVGLGPDFKIGDFVGTFSLEPVQLSTTAKVASKVRIPFKLKCIPYDSTSLARVRSMFIRGALLM